MQQHEEQDSKTEEKPKTANGKNGYDLDSAAKVSEPQEAERKDGFAEGLDPDRVKWEHDIFRDVLSNVNQTLRFQISLAVPLMAACVTMLNIVPPQAHQELLNDFDRWVFVPALASIGISYHGLERHWYVDKKLNKLNENIEALYELVRYKDRMVHLSVGFQAIAVILMMTFVLLEFK